MATTLDADQEALVHFSFPIEKQEDTDFINPVDGTPDVWIVGKATDGTIDADRQIVDPQWSAVALKEWAATGGNVRMSHDPKRPVGKGHDVQVTTDGHYVKSLISDPLAKHFIRTGVLNDYSVGISMPHIKFGTDKNLDPQGKATGGIITGRPDGLSKIAELSVVDRGANFGSRFQMLRKSAGDGDDFGFVGKMVGDPDEIARAAPPDLLAKIDGGNLLTKSAAADDLVSVDLPPGASISISPADFARLHTFKQQLATKASAGAVAEKRDFDRGVGGGVDRDKLPDSDFAGPHRSFPIVTQSDVSDALGLAGHADDPDAVRARIHAIARRKGFSVPDDNDSKNKGTKEVAEPAAEVAEKAADAPAEQAEAVPDVTKDPEPKPVKKAKKKAKGPKKMPPWLKGDDDAKGGSDGKDDDDSSCKSVSDHLWTGIEGTSTIECSKCHTTPAAAAGVTTAPMQAAPVKELQTSDGPACTKSGPTPASASGAVAGHMTPVPRHREPDGAPMEAMERTAKLSDGDDEKPTRLEAATGMKYAADLAPDPEVAALLRFKAAGTPEDLGRLHDLTCPAFHPEMAAKYHPYADMAALIDAGAWQRKTLHAAAGPLDGALKMQEMWQAALLLKTADTADLNDWRLELHKAFRDANPGPGTYPTPGCVSPGGYNRPVLTDGRAANGVDYAGPNSSPQVATTAPDADSFDRPPLSAGHQSPSPSHMKGDGTYPSERGVPVQLSYAQAQREGARQALVRMHHYLARQFPEACPIDFGLPAQPERHAVPVPAGIGKGEGGIVPSGPGDVVPAPVAAALKATPEQEADLFADAEVLKSFKKMRRKLGKKILSGKMTVDEARAHLGRQFAQKGDGEPQEAVQKSAALSPPPSVPDLLAPPAAPVPVAADLSAIVKAAIAEALPPAVPLEPLTATVSNFGTDPEVIKSALAEVLAPFTDQVNTKLAEQQKVIDAIADQPDPSTAAFSGLAFQPGVVKSRRPAAVPDQAEYAARAQQMVRRNLQNTYQTHSDPYVREAAGQSLAAMGVGVTAEAPMT